jgi:hypothetical protein
MPEEETDALPDQTPPPPKFTDGEFKHNSLSLPPLAVGAAKTVISTSSEATHPVASVIVSVRILVVEAVQLGFGEGAIPVAPVQT